MPWILLCILPAKTLGQLPSRLAASSNVLEDRVWDVAQDLRAGRIPLNDLPRIKVVRYNGKIHSVSNRRLYCLKFAGVHACLRMRACMHA